MESRHETNTFFQACKYSVFTTKRIFSVQEIKPDKKIIMYFMVQNNTQTQIDGYIYTYIRYIQNLERERERSRRLQIPFRKQQIRLDSTRKRARPNIVTWKVYYKRMYPRRTPKFKEHSRPLQFTVFIAWNRCYLSSFILLVGWSQAPHA